MVSVASKFTMPRVILLMICYIAMMVVAHAAINDRKMSQNPQIVQTSNAKEYKEYENSVTASEDAYKHSLDNGLGHHRQNERRLQVIAYVCSKQLCRPKDNCTIRDIGKHMAVCMDDAIHSRSDTELNEKYKLNKRSMFMESQYSNLQLMLFAAANVTNLQSAKNFTRLVANADHSNGDTLRLMLSDTLYEKMGAAHNSSAEIIINRLKEVLNLNKTRKFFLFQNDEEWQEFMSEFAVNSPWYATLIVAFFIKLALMYGFHLRQFYKCCCGGGGGRSSKKHIDPDTFLPPSKPKNKSAINILRRKRNNQAQPNNMVFDNDDVEMITLPFVTTSNNVATVHSFGN